MRERLASRHFAWYDKVAITVVLSGALAGIASLALRLATGS